jgi:hypothetical protein
VNHQGCWIRILCVKSPALLCVPAAAAAAAAAGLQELNDRDKFLQVLLEKYQQANQQPAAADAVAVISSSGSKQGSSANAVSSGPPLLPEEAVAVIIRNERGRQVRCSTAATAAVPVQDSIRAVGCDCMFAYQCTQHRERQSMHDRCCSCLQARERTRLVASAKRSRAVEERRRQAGVALSKDEAVTKIQVWMLLISCCCVKQYACGPIAQTALLGPITTHIMPRCSWRFWSYCRNGKLVLLTGCTAQVVLAQHGPAKIDEE